MASPKKRVSRKRKIPEAVSRITLIDIQVDIATFLINKVRGAINDPTENNFSNVLDDYNKWIFNTYTFLKKFDEVSAHNFISASDGIRTLLNALNERSKNIVPMYFFIEDSKGNVRVDENGVAMLRDMIISLTEKVNLLTDVRLNILGGIKSEKDTDNPTIIFLTSGAIRTSLDDQEIRRRRSTIILKIVKKLRSNGNIKLTSLEKDLKYAKGNISRDIII